MRRMLIDDDERVFGFGDNEGVLKLGSRGAKRIVGAESTTRRSVSARVAARLGERRKRRLRSFGKGEAPRTSGGMVLANALRRRRPTGGLPYTLERGRGTMASSAKRIPQRADEERAHGIRIAKPELGLGWVHVH